MNKIIRFRGTTDHCGSVIESIQHTNISGKPIASMGPFPITEGSSTYTVNGVAVALDGMKTACGAKLIASGSRASVHR